MYKLISLLPFLYVLSFHAFAEEKKTYKVDLKPFTDFPEEAKKYKQLQTKFESEPLSRDEHAWRIALLKKIIEKHPKWLDGYWILAGESLQLGSSYSDPSEHEVGKKILVKGRDAVKTCLDIDKDQTICKFLYGSMIAKIASIDGIFASLKHAELVHDTWLEVTEADLNVPFRPNVSLQGVAYFGLGVFYRVVPDLALVDWIFGVRGNIDKSIEFHQKSAEFDPANPCNRLMLAVSLLCKIKGDAKHPYFKQAMNELEVTAKTEPIDLAQSVCVKDVAKIKADPKKTCGYTQAKYQEEGDPSELE